MLEIFKKKKYVTIDYLVKTLCYSESTIRRDLRKLEKLGLIKRSSGSALLIKDELKENPLIIKEKINSDKKNYIADIAMNFIGDYATIFLDASSTNLILSRRLNERKHLTVFTTNLATALELDRTTDHEIYVIGGHLHDGKVDGGMFGKLITRFQFDIVFISCRGFDISFGASDILETEATIKQQALSNSKQVILLADSTKMNKKFTFQSAQISDIDKVISDKNIKQEYINVLLSASVEFLC